MAKLQLFFIMLLAASLLATENSQSIDSKNHLLLVHKTPTCGCCKEWIKHAKNHGFNVTTQDHQSLEEIKSMYKITSDYRSCHTTVSSNGFVFEGHIPSKYIEKFLSEDHPNAIGLTVPGMPLGSPGMDFGDRFMPYDVLILFKDGSSEVYAEVRK
ncbi:DUF411 domain-containing protein [Gammaproteobacteria bacterium]|nr:DUF411 domain-containing protein [Gammaproteobacteria bacterium]